MGVALGDKKGLVLPWAGAAFGGKVVYRKAAAEVVPLLSFTVPLRKFSTLLFGSTALRDNPPSYRYTRPGRDENLYRIIGVNIRFKQGSGSAEATIGVSDGPPPGVGGGRVPFNQTQVRWQVAPGVILDASSMVEDGNTVHNRITYRYYTFRNDSDFIPPDETATGDYPMAILPPE